MSFQNGWHENLFTVGGVLARLNSFQGLLLSMSLVTVFSIWYMVRKLEVFKQLRFSTVELPGFDYLYVQHIGPYSQIHGIYSKVRKDTRGNIKAKGMIGILYDDPKTTDPSSLRTVVGVVVQEFQDSQVLKEFISKRTEYSLVTLKACQILKTQVPLINQISFMLVPFKAIPGLFNHMQKEGVPVNSGGVIQIYGMPEESVSVAVPLTNFSQFDLCKMSPNNKKE